MKPLTQLPILIVDDDPASLQILKLRLQALGHPVRTASDGLEALESFQSEPTRIVISDLNMPRLDGFNLCRRLRDSDEFHYTYFLLITSEDATTNFDKAIAAGVDDFLTKPLNNDLLAARLHVATRILEHTRRIRSLETLVTMCAYTKRVQGPDGQWQSIEEFVKNYMGADISHGVDPDYYENTLKAEWEKVSHELRNPDTPPS